MTRFGRLGAAVAAALVGLAGTIAALRVVNARRYPAPHGFPTDLGQAGQYQLDQPKMTIIPISGEYLNGFWLVPDSVTRRGLVVIWGGSEGSPEFDRAVRIASHGYRVLALFYFGQPNQQPKLANVPLDFFDEVVAWYDRHAGDGPLTVIGLSRGAELALLLQERYPQIDNVVVFSPTKYAWQGLDYRRELPSWTWRGQPVPYVSFRYAMRTSTARMFADMLTNRPVHLRMQHASAAAHDPGSEAARIGFNLKGHLLAFAGDEDALWPSEQAAEYWASLAPGRTEAKIFPGAGHLFGPLDGWAAGYAMGGNWGANQAALNESNAMLDARLAAWHPLA